MHVSGVHKTWHRDRRRPWQGSNMKRPNSKCNGILNKKVNWHYVPVRVDWFTIAGGAVRCYYLELKRLVLTLVDSPGELWERLSYIDYLFHHHPFVGG